MQPPVLNVVAERCHRAKSPLPGGRIFLRRSTSTISWRRGPGAIAGVHQNRPFAIARIAESKDGAPLASSAERARRQLLPRSPQPAGSTPNAGQVVPQSTSWSRVLTTASPASSSSRSSPALPPTFYPAPAYGRILHPRQATSFLFRFLSCGRPLDHARRGCRIG